MAANEIAERLAASCWLSLGPLDSPGAPVAAQIFYRSMVGFTQRIISTDNLPQLGLVLLFLDRELSRRETTIHATQVYTTNLARQTYPVANLEVIPDVLAIQAPQVQPFHTDWIGGDYTAPNWLPFTLDPALLGADFNPDVYNGIALLNPFSDTNSGDICVTIFEHQLYQGPTDVEYLIPVSV